MLSDRKTEEFSLQQEKLPLFHERSDPEMVVNDEVDTMAWPMFSLSKNRRTKPLEFNRGPVSIKVTGDSEYGIANIWDYEFLIYLVSKITDAQKRGMAVSRKIKFYANEFFQFTGRPAGGRQYEALKATLTRLHRTTIETTINADNEEKGVASFHWVDAFKMEKTKDTVKGKRQEQVEVVLCDWFYQLCLADKNLLVVDRGFFNLKKGIEKRVYSILAREAALNMQAFAKGERIKIGLHRLHELAGTLRNFSGFSFDLRHVVEANNLPDFDLSFGEAEENDPAFRAGAIYLIARKSKNTLTDNRAE